MVTSQPKFWRHGACPDTDSIYRKSNKIRISLTRGIVKFLCVMSSASSSTKSKAAKAPRNNLSLKQKYEVIDAARKNPAIGIRALAEKFSCGRTQVSTILKNKETILQLYESNMSSTSLLARKRCRQSDFAPVNETLYKWYSLATSRNIYPAGPQLCEKAKQIADQLSIQEFKASNGWLEKWKARYNIKQMRISGESGDVSGQTIESWKERLPEILRGYSARNIWNIDETGCFWRAMPETGFGKKGSQCHGDKKAKQRFTVALMVNAAGEKQPPIVIWKSEKPRCFKGIKIDQLPVQYYSQSKAWMTGDILDAVLSKLNRKLSSRGRSIALLMDNAGCHPEELKDKYSNIKIVFLPPNTTSKLQPLDLGIIQNFKVHYRKLLLSFVLSKIDDTTYTASQIAKTVNVLKAIRWVAEAWECVKTETVIKCFKSSGISVDSSESVIGRMCEDEDPFAEIDNSEEITTLVTQIGPSVGPTCSAEEYVNGDNDLPFCEEMDSDDWDEQFMSNLTTSQSQEFEESDDEQFDLEPPPPKIKDFKEAVSMLEDVQTFLDSRGYNEAATKMGLEIDTVVSLQHDSLNCARQTTLDEFF